LVALPGVLVHALRLRRHPLRRGWAKWPAASISKDSLSRVLPPVAGSPARLPFAASLATSNANFPDRG
jgi:hypothetical protein